MFWFLLWQDSPVSPCTQCLDVSLFIAGFFRSMSASMPVTALLSSLIFWLSSMSSSLSQSFSIFYCFVKIRHHAPSTFMSARWPFSNPTAHDRPFFDSNIFLVLLDDPNWPFMLRKYPMWLMSKFLHFTKCKNLFHMDLGRFGLPLIFVWWAETFNVSEK